MHIKFARKTDTQEKSWTVCDAATGEQIGSVEWLTELGFFGFGCSPCSGVFAHGPVMAEIGRFLDRMNARTAASD